MKNLEEESLKYSKFELYKILDNGSSKLEGIFNLFELKNICNDRGFLIDSLLVTLKDYPNIRRRRKQYKGYYLIGIKDTDLQTEEKISKPNQNLFNKREIDFEKGKISAEKIIHLDEKNISEENILKEFNLDIKDWTIEKLNYSLWDSRDKDRGTIPLYSVKCSFKKREKLDFDINAMKNIIDSYLYENKDLEDFSDEDYAENIDEDTLLLNIADLHLNKLSEDYNVKIARNRYIEALRHIVKNSEANNCIFIVGEDFFNVDTLNKTTTRGTPQDTEVDIYSMFDIGLNLMIESIKYLSEVFYDVKVILIQGNHDNMLSYMLCIALSIYPFNKTVSIDTEPIKRKYINVGNSLIGLGHLDSESKEQKKFLMQNEVKEKYGESKYNYFVSGHFHNYSVEEIGGISYIRLPSLSGNDNWHNSMGYVTQIRGAVGLEFSRDRGLIKQIMYNIER